MVHQTHASPLEPQQGVTAGWPGADKGGAAGPVAVNVRPG